jgi:hypothetical protein
VHWVQLGNCRATSCHCRKPGGAHTAVDMCFTAAPGMLLLGPQDGQANPKLGKNRLTAYALTGLQRGLTMYDSVCNFGARNS